MILLLLKLVFEPKFVWDVTSRSIFWQIPLNSPEFSDVPVFETSANLPELVLFLLVLVGVCFGGW